MASKQSLEQAKETSSAVDESGPLPPQAILNEVYEVYITTGDFQMSSEAKAIFQYIWRMTIGEYIDRVREHNPPVDMWRDPVFHRWARRCVARWARVTSVLGAHNPTILHVYLGAYGVIYTMSDRYCEADIPEAIPIPPNEVDARGNLAPFQKACRAFTETFALADFQAVLTKLYS